ncbi:MAG: hypothetical protein Q8P24_02290 [Desulfobacterales bacterium]|nr:hypothetical protein [Desulfobacterales bacterium]
MIDDLKAHSFPNTIVDCFWMVDLLNRFASAIFLKLIEFQQLSIVRVPSIANRQSQIPSPPIQSGIS